MALAIWVIAGLSAAQGAVPARAAAEGALDRVAMVVAAPSDFTLFGLGVAGLIVGRLILGRRRKPRPPVTEPRSLD